LWFVNGLLASINQEGKGLSGQLRTVDVAFALPGELAADSFKEIADCWPGIYLDKECHEDYEDKLRNGDHGFFSEYVAGELISFRWDNGPAKAEICEG